MAAAGGTGMEEAAEFDEAVEELHVSTRLPKAKCRTLARLGLDFTDILGFLISDIKARVKELVDCLRDKGKLGEIDVGTFKTLLNGVSLAMNRELPRVADVSDLFALLKEKNWNVKDSVVQAFLDAAAAPMPILAPPLALASAAGGAGAGGPALAALHAPVPTAPLPAGGAGAGRGGGSGRPAATFGTEVLRFLAAEDCPVEVLQAALPSLLATKAFSDWRKESLRGDVGSWGLRATDFSRAEEVFSFLRRLEVTFSPELWDDVAGFAVRVVDSEFRWSTREFVEAALELKPGVLIKLLPFDDSGESLELIDLLIDRCDPEGVDPVREAWGASSTTAQNRRIQLLMRESGGGKSKLGFDLGTQYASVLFIRLTKGKDVPGLTLPYKEWLVKVASWNWDNISLDRRVSQTKCAIALLLVLKSCYADFGSAAMAVIRGMYNPDLPKRRELLLRLFRNGRCEDAVQGEFIRRVDMIKRGKITVDPWKMVVSSLKTLRSVCGDVNLILFFDEVQSLVDKLRSFGSLMGTVPGAAAGESDDVEVASVATTATTATAATAAAGVAGADASRALSPEERAASEAAKQARLEANRLASSGLAVDLKEFCATCLDELGRLIATRKNTGAKYVGRTHIKSPPLKSLRDAHDVFSHAVNTIFQENICPIILAGTFINVDDDESFSDDSSSLRGWTEWLRMDNTFDVRRMEALVRKYYAIPEDTPPEAWSPLKVLEGRPHWFVSFVFVELYKFLGHSTYVPEAVQQSVAGALVRATSSVVRSITRFETMNTGKLIHGVRPLELLERLVLALSFGSSSLATSFAAPQRRLFSVVRNNPDGDKTRLLRGFTKEVPTLNGLLAMRFWALEEEIRRDRYFSFLDNQLRSTALDAAAKGKIFEEMLIWVLFREARNPVRASKLLKKFAARDDVVNTALLKKVWVCLSHAVDAHNPDEVFEEMTAAEADRWFPWRFRVQETESRPLWPDGFAQTARRIVRRPDCENDSSFDFLFDADGFPILGRVVFNAESGEAGPDIAFVGQELDGTLWLFIVQAKATIDSSLRESMRSLNPSSMGADAADWFVRNPDVFGDRIVRLPAFVAPFRPDTLDAIRFLNSNLDNPTCEVPSGLHPFVKDVRPIRGVVVPVGTKSFGDGVTKYLSSIIVDKKEDEVTYVANIGASRTNPPKALWQLSFPAGCVFHASPRVPAPAHFAASTGTAGGGGGRGGGSSSSSSSSSDLPPPPPEDEDEGEDRFVAFTAPSSGSRRAAGEGSRRPLGGSEATGRRRKGRKDGDKARRHRNEDGAEKEDKAADDEHGSKRARKG